MDSPKDFSAQGFHEFFESKPPETWTTGSLTKGDTHCALGFLGGYHTVASNALTALVAKSKCSPCTLASKSGIVWHTNDGVAMFKELAHPRDRILHMLKLVMESESLEDFLDEIGLEAFGEFEATTTGAVEITEATFDSLTNADARVSNDKLKVEDNGFLASILAGASLQAEINQAQKELGK